MGKGVAEIADMLSFPELFLILRRDAKRKAADLRFMATAQTLAACSPWSKEAAKRANDFINSFAEKRAKPEESANQLMRMFAGAGIPINKE